MITDPCPRDDAGLACRVRLSRAPADVAAAQRLRHLCFIEGAGLPPRAGGLDRDGFDPRCLHLLVEDSTSGQLLACCRILSLPDGAALGQSYAALHYDPRPLAHITAPMAEIGRFCLHPDAPADALRFAWAALARLVDARGIAMLFGCSSFPGADPAAHLPALAYLARNHLGPEDERPGHRDGQDVYPYAQALAGQPPDSARGLAGLPPLLRAYLAMGGWVGDHAVIDHDLDTLHVFTALRVAAVPASRAQRLRELSRRMRFDVQGAD